MNEDVMAHFLGPAIRIYFQFHPYLVSGRDMYL